MSEQAKKRGLLEDVRLNCEVMVTASFDNVRWLIRRVLLMPEPQSRSLAQELELETPLNLVRSLCTTWYCCGLTRHLYITLATWLSSKRRHRPGAQLHAALSWHTCLACFELAKRRLSTLHPGPNLPIYDRVWKKRWSPWMLLHRLQPSKTLPLPLC